MLKSNLLYLNKTKIVLNKFYYEKGYDSIWGI